MTMLAIDQNRRHWVGLYGLTLAVLVGLACWAYVRLPSYLDPPFDFYTMKKGERFNVHNMTRRQEGSVKLGFATSYAPPMIGIFGNHIIGYFSGEAFGRPEEPEYFFNYSYANLSLPEIYSYVRLLEQRGRLPKKLMLVQITAPNADNGHFIVTLGNELPSEVAGNVLEEGGFLGRIWQRVWSAWIVVTNNMHEVLNYNTFALSLLQGDYGHRVVSPSDCRSETPAWLSRMPHKLQAVINAYRGRDYYCDRHTWGGAYRRDGSVDAEFGAEGPVDTPPPVPNENPLKAAERGISAGDEVEIARYLTAIDAVGRRHGVAVVFLVPPVYEKDRHDSVVNKVFNRALALVPDLTIIDHRALRNDPTLFLDALHPSAKYYRMLVDELRRRGLVE